MFDIEIYFEEFFKHPTPVALRYWGEVYDDMSVHTRGITPTKLLKNRRPYEPEEIQKYRQDSYEPFTKDPVDRAIVKSAAYFQQNKCQH